MASAAAIATQFVKAYYQLLNKDPDNLHNLYQKDSIFARVDKDAAVNEVQHVVGKDAIKKRLSELGTAHTHTHAHTPHTHTHKHSQATRAPASRSTPSIPRSLLAARSWSS